MANSGGGPNSAFAARPGPPVTPMLSRFSTRRGDAEQHDGEQLAPDDLAPLGRAAEQRFQRAALLFAGAQVDGRIKRAGQRPQQQHERQDLRPQRRLAAARLGHVDRDRPRTAGPPSRADGWRRVLPADLFGPVGQHRVGPQVGDLRGFLGRVVIERRAGHALPVCRLRRLATRARPRRRRPAETLPAARQNRGETRSRLQTPCCNSCEHAPASRRDAVAAGGLQLGSRCAVGVRPRLVRRAAASGRRAFAQQSRHRSELLPARQEQVGGECALRPAAADRRASGRPTTSTRVGCSRMNCAT